MNNAGLRAGLAGLLLAGAASAAVVDVLSHGAVANDAVSDTAAIQAALNAAASAGGGVVKIPAGVFIAADLKIGNGVALRGEGRGVSILQLAAGTAAGKAILANADTVNGNSLIGLYDLSFDGNRSNQVNSTHCLKMSRVEELTVAGCEFFDASYYGMFVDAATNLVVQNSYAVSCAQSGFHFLNQRDMRLIGCEAFGNSGSGFVLNYCEWSTLTVCHAIENALKGFSFGSVRNTSVSGCRASANGGDGVSTYAPGGACEYMTFNGVSSGENDGNGFLFGGIRNTTVNHCHSMSNALNGASVTTFTGSETTRSITWQGGVIGSNGRHGLLLSGVQQFVLGGAVICDNSGESAGTYDGVRITSGGGVSSERVKIAGCVIRNTGTPLTQNYAVYAAGGSDRIYVYTTDVTDQLQSSPINISAAPVRETGLNQGE